MRLTRRILIFASLALVVALPVQAAPPCNGKFPNPITDICWSCALPLRIGKTKVMSLDQEDNTSSNSASTVCYCDNAGVPKLGINTSFFEPARIAEVVRNPYCFPSLGGSRIDFGIDAPVGAREARKDGKSAHAFYHVHWYLNPLMFWLEILIDNFCLENGVFDLSYLTELDPFWADSATTFIFNPDVVLYANPIGQAACAADCIAATSGFPNNLLYWCAGCQGSMYPLNGYVKAMIGGVQASSLLAQRFTNKLHREGVMWAASGSDGQCGHYPQILMDKTNYKMQMLYPIPNTNKQEGKCCQPMGRTTAIWGSGKEFPYKGEDFTYQIFRKRDCCSGNLLNTYAP